MKKRRIILVFKEKNMGIVGKKTDLISTSGDKFLEI
jgi:seryl-tRNA(Sec) selenium transferase